MLKYLPLIKKYALEVLPTIIILSFFYIFTQGDYDEKAKDEIKKLKLENQGLKKTNDSIFATIKTFEDDISKQDEIISHLFNEQESFYKTLDSLDLALTKTKQKYEKATNHSNNFSSTEISKYFSNL